MGVFVLVGGFGVHDVAAGVLQHRIPPLQTCPDFEESLRGDLQGIGAPRALGPGPQTQVLAEQNVNAQPGHETNRRKKARLPVSSFFWRHYVINSQIIICQQSQTTKDNPNRRRTKQEPDQALATSGHPEVSIFFSIIPILPQYNPNIIL